MLLRRVGSGQDNESIEWNMIACKSTQAVNQTVRTEGHAVGGGGVEEGGYKLQSSPAHLYWQMTKQRRASFSDLPSRD
jgi:hypothetical protein